MSRVSLILPTVDKGPWPVAEIPAWRSALIAAGHEVDVIVAGGSGSVHGAEWRSVPSREPGLAAAAITGLEAAPGEILLVLDPSMGYAAADLDRVVRPLENGQVDLVVASRCHPGKAGKLSDGIWSAWGRLVRLLTGTADPMTGLIGLTRTLFNTEHGRYRAVGTKFSFELLTRLGGRWVDVPVHTAAATWRIRPGWDDLRHLKRLADHRFGNLSRLIQFCAVGASGMVVDLTFYAAFQWLFVRTVLASWRTPLISGPLYLAVAGSLSIAVALCWNFGLNRRLTFSYARHGAIVRQFLAYAFSNAVSIPVSLTLRLILPLQFSFFNQHKLAAAVVGIVAATGISFSMSRWVVFRGHPTGRHPSDVDKQRPQVAHVEPSDGSVGCETQAADKPEGVTVPSPPMIMERTA